MWKTVKWVHLRRVAGKKNPGINQGKMLFFSEMLALPGFGLLDSFH